MEADVDPEVTTRRFNMSDGGEEGVYSGMVRLIDDTVLSEEHLGMVNEITNIEKQSCYIYIYINKYMNPLFVNF